MHRNPTAEQPRAPQVDQGHSSVATHRKGERTRTYTYQPRPEARM